MNNEDEKLKKVLALFDTEDLKYIDFEKIKCDEEKKNKSKVKKIGENNDRRIK